MKRHPALIPLSHDHHHGLVQARRLRRAAARPAAERRNAAAVFLQFFASDTRPRFRDEEEQLFPLLVGAEASVTMLVVHALLEHQRLHALVQALEGELAGGDAPAAQMQELADTLEGHIRFEEQTLFPLIETLAPEAALRRLQEASATRAAADLNAREGTGPLWGAETEDLNATLLAWPPDAGPVRARERGAGRASRRTGRVRDRHGRRRGANDRWGSGDDDRERKLSPDRRRLGRSPLPLRPHPTAAAADLSGRLLQGMIAMSTR